MLETRVPFSLVPRLSPQNTLGGESLVTSAGKAVDFHRLALVVPIRLQNKTACAREIFTNLQGVVYAYQFIFELTIFAEWTK